MAGREIRQALLPDRELTYQSVMTTLGIMEEKGYVKRRKAGANFVYRARITEQATSKRMLNDLVRRLFDGSASAAMLNLLQTSDLTDEELDRIRETIQRRR